jgi:hypothetical protein
LQAMRLFEQFALQRASEGRRFGFAALAERVRWDCDIDRDGKSAFKIPNAHRAYIARFLLARHPHLHKFMRIATTREEREGVC